MKENQEGEQRAGTRNVDTHTNASRDVAGFGNASCPLVVQFWLPHELREYRNTK